MQAKNNISWETQHIFPIDISFFPFITMKLIIPIPTQGFYFSNVEHQILHYLYAIVLGSIFIPLMGILTFQYIIKNID